MNTFVSSVVANERHNDYIAQAAAHRRSRSNVHSNRPGRQHRSVGAFLKDVAAAVL